MSNSFHIDLSSIYQDNQILAWNTWLCILDIVLVCIRMFRNKDGKVGISYLHRNNIRWDKVHQEYKSAQPQ